MIRLLMEIKCTASTAIRQSAFSTWNPLMVMNSTDEEADVLSIGPPQECKRDV